MIVAADAGDNPLADRREDREAAAARERKAKVAKLNSQTANAMEVVRAQQAAKERGAFDEAALRANEVAGAPVKGTSAMVARIFDSRRDGKDWKMVQRREQRKTQTGAGTAANSYLLIARTLRHNTSLLIICSRVFTHRNFTDDTSSLIL